MVDVTKAEQLFDAILGNVGSYAEWGQPHYREEALRTINEFLTRPAPEKEKEE